MLEYGSYPFTSTPLIQDAMQDRQQHRPEVQAFLQKHIASPAWQLTLPHGLGHETYFARCAQQTCFIKLGVQVARLQALAALGLTPPVLASGVLQDGVSIIVQPYINGRNPSRADYRLHLEQFAAAILALHHSPELQRLLPRVASEDYSAAGMRSLDEIRQRWGGYRARVPDVAGFIDESLASLARQVGSFQGSGLVASHNDICNANWLITPDEQLYLIDLESMSLDDPALDIGATLWWYYPPALRPRFLELVGYANDEAFQTRMQVRMALHCLSINLPRQYGFQGFDPATYAGALVDFRAIMAGEDNPQGFAS